MKALIEKYAKAIKIAQVSALEVSSDEDGGTSNLDSVVINFSGWRQASINKIAELSGIRIGEKLSSFWKGHCFIRFELHGQGSNRTRMVEAANKKLQELDVPACVYYQMD